MVKICWMMIFHHQFTKILVNILVNITEIWWMMIGKRILRMLPSILRWPQTLTPWQDPKQKSCSSAMEFWDGSEGQVGHWVQPFEPFEVLDFCENLENLEINGKPHKSGDFFPAGPPLSPPALWGFSERSRSSTTLPRPSKVGRGGISHVEFQNQMMNAPTR